LFIENDTHHTTVSINDLSGRRLLNRQITGNQIDVGNLPQGTYLLKITTPKGSATAKFVKE